MFVFVQGYRKQEIMRLLRKHTRTFEQLDKIIHVKNKTLNQKCQKKHIFSRDSDNLKQVKIFSEAVKTKY